MSHVRIGGETRRRCLASADCLDEAYAGSTSFWGWWNAVDAAREGLGDVFSEADGEGRGGRPVFFVVGVGARGLAKDFGGTDVGQKLWV